MTKSTWPAEPHRGSFPRDPTASGCHSKAIGVWCSLGARTLQGCCRQGSQDWELWVFQCSVMGVSVFLASMHTAADAFYN